jgi:hypothetical protein
VGGAMAGAVATFVYCLIYRSLSISFDDRIQIMAIACPVLTA